ncbi:hypothetical protein KO516_07925 [Citreicella sp. C3M06]|uniref:hypothetical protein n=1 Tax=Citreicella sp. C3M06 TaxID=2841564 RepID=UPI001C07FAEE|nr:hypothetical protein [Citreicella sp. C3M06]MBU2960747.1 hypothetical protein [Citreicella sp. C3M06]
MAIETSYPIALWRAMIGFALTRQRKGRAARHLTACANMRRSPITARIQPTRPTPPPSPKRIHERPVLGQGSVDDEQAFGLTLPIGTDARG